MREGRWKEEGEGKRWGKGEITLSLLGRGKRGLLEGSRGAKWHQGRHLMKSPHRGPRPAVIRGRAPRVTLRMDSARAA